MLGEKHLQVFRQHGKLEGARVTCYPAQGASRNQISAHYEEELTDHGWEAEKSPNETRATSGGLRYVVQYWRDPNDTEVEVRVFRP